jgi:hypothetical protein
MTTRGAESSKRPEIPPSEAATLERAFSLVNEAMHTVALQRRRLATEEPEDRDFPMRRWADWEFFISALWRLRRRAQIAAGPPTNVNDPHTAAGRLGPTPRVHPLSDT